MITPEYNPVDEKKMRRQERRLQAALKKMFGTDESGDPRVEVQLVDRSRYHRPYALPVPYGHLTQNTQEHFMVVRAVVANLHTACEQAKLELDRLERLHEQDLTWEMVKLALKRVFKDTPFTLESNHSFYEAKPPHHYWSRVRPEDPLKNPVHKFNARTGFDPHSDLEPFLETVKKSRRILVRRHRNAIVAFTVVVNSYGGFVTALVKMSPEEIEQAKHRAEVRRRLFEAEEKKMAKEQRGS